MVGKTVALLEQKNDMRALLSASLTGESRTTCALSVKRHLLHKTCHSSTLCLSVQASALAVGGLQLLELLL